MRMMRVLWGWESGCVRFRERAAVGLPARPRAKRGAIWPCTHVPAICLWREYLTHSGRGGRVPAPSGVTMASITNQTAARFFLQAAVCPG